MENTLGAQPARERRYQQVRASFAAFRAAERATTPPLKIHSQRERLPTIPALESRYSARLVVADTSAAAASRRAHRPRTGDPDFDQVAADAVAHWRARGVALRPGNSWTTCRLNSIECVRCLAMGPFSSIARFMATAGRERCSSQARSPQPPAISCASSAGNRASCLLHGATQDSAGRDHLRQG